MIERIAGDARSMLATREDILVGRHPGSGRHAHLHHVHQCHSWLVLLERGLKHPMQLHPTQLPVERHTRLGAGACARTCPCLRLLAHPLDGSGVEAGQALSNVGLHLQPSLAVQRLQRKL
jgi:hypothetical protein